MVSKSKKVKPPQTSENSDLEKKDRLLVLSCTIQAQKLFFKFLKIFQNFLEFFFRISFLYLIINYNQKFVYFKFFVFYGFVDQNLG